MMAVPNFYRLEMVSRWVPAYTPAIDPPLDIRNGTLYLSDRPGLGIKGMDAQSVAHLLMLSFIVIGNVGYFLSRRQERKLKEE